MITQTITRWLKKLFAWRPWKRSMSIAYAPSTSSWSTNVSQEQVWHTMDQAPQPSPGTTSVALEQSGASTLSELSPDKNSSGENPATLPPTASLSAPPFSSEANAQNDDQKQDNGQSMITPEQRLAFLRYLVQRGIVNEGFREDNKPEQYKNKKS